MYRSWWPHDPGGNSVIELPGETPTSPLMVLGPVLVTAAPPRTPKLSAVPKMDCASAWLLEAITARPGAVATASANGTALRNPPVPKPRNLLRSAAKTQGRAYRSPHRFPHPLCRIAHSRGGTQKAGGPIGVNTDGRNTWIARVSYLLWWFPRDWAHVLRGRRDTVAGKSRDGFS